MITHKYINNIYEVEPNGRQWVILVWAVSWNRYGQVGSKIEEHFHPTLSFEHGRVIL
jgi:hypothetical protein